MIKYKCIKPHKNFFKKNDIINVIKDDYSALFSLIKYKNDEVVKYRKKYLAEHFLNLKEAIKQDRKRIIDKLICNN